MLFELSGHVLILSASFRTSSDATRHFRHLISNHTTTYIRDKTSRNDLATCSSLGARKPQPPSRRFWSYSLRSTCNTLLSSWVILSHIQRGTICSSCVCVCTGCYNCSCELSATELRFTRTGTTKQQFNLATRITFRAPKQYRSIIGGPSIGQRLVNEH